MGNEQSSFLETANDSLTTASGYVCGSLSDTFNESPNRSSSRQRNDRKHNNNRPSSPLVPSELICASKAFRRSFSTGSLVSSSTFTENNDNNISKSRNGPNNNPMSALFARALISEVSHDHNPNAMTPSEMAAREKQLLQAQERARRNVSVSQFMKQINLWGGGNSSNNVNAGVEEVRGSGSNSTSGKGGMLSRSYPPNQLHENRARLDNGHANNNTSYIDNTLKTKHTVTIGLSLSRRHTIGHPDTVTRQTAFDFNELQDRAYKYVSSTDASGWRAGGGERGGVSATDGRSSSPMMNDENQQAHKIASPDTVHIPIIQIDADSPAAVDSIIASLARGEIFIPHMSVLPEALSVNGVSPPDLIVRFGCERNDDLPPDEWPNWSLEFMHNQLYEYFAPLGARWMKRPFQITLAHKVRWRTVKHMNKYFAHAERVISAWREKGPQYLNPQLSYIEGGATPEEVARPHGIYLLRDGRPTNYFCPNLEPPYTTKMTRSLLLNVLNKSWDNKRRDWSSEPQQSLIAPSLLLGAMCGCDNTAVAGFMPNQTMTPTNRDILEKQPAIGAIEATTTPSKKVQSSRSKDNADQQQQSPPPRTKKRSSSRKHNVTSSSSSQMDSSNNRTSQPQHNKPIPQSKKAESSPTRSDPRYSPSYSAETSPVISEAGVSDIPERVSDVGESNVILEEKMILSKNNNSNNNSNPPKPEESCPSPSIEEQKPNKIDKSKRENNNKISSNKSDLTSNSESDVDVVADLPTGQFIADVQSVGESQTTDPTSNVASFRLAKEREQRKQREIEMLRERKKMEEIEAAIKRKREKEVKVEESSPQNEQQQQQAQKQQLQVQQKQKEAQQLALQQQRKQEEQAQLLAQQQAQKLKHQQEQKLKQQQEQFKQQEQQKLKLAQQQAQQQQQKEQNQQQTKQAKAPLKLKDPTDRQPQRPSPQNNITAQEQKQQQQKASPKGSPKRAILSPPPIKTSPRQNQLLPEQQFENFFPTNFFNDTSTTTTSTTTINQLPSPHNKQSNNSQILQQQQQQIFTQQQQFSWSPHRNNRLIRSNSADTLEYSLDSFSISQYTNNQNSNNIPFDSQSVTTLNTAAGQSLLSYVTRSTIGGGDGNSSYYNNNHHNTKNDDYYEPIPTDEELFTIGWAKALDTKSGSYYYFTLDRSKIVWDNPLRNRH